MKKLVSTHNAHDVVKIKSVLDSEGIYYLIYSENIGSLHPFIEPTIFMVHEDEFEKADELIRDLNINYTVIPRRDYGKTRTGWKIYFLLMCVLLAVIKVQTLSLGLSIESCIDTVISMSALAGLYGYAYQKKIMNRLLWKIIWVLVMLWFVLTLATMQNNVHLLSIIIGAIIIAPKYIALYLYGFRSDELWEELPSCHGEEHTEESRGLQNN